MAKKNGKLVKKITIDKLAEIINDGFDGQMVYMEKKFGAIDTKFSQMASKNDLEEVEKSLKEVKTVLTDAHVL